MEAALALARAQFPPPPARHLRRRDRGGAGDQRGRRCTASSAPILCAGLALVWLEPRLWAGGGRLWRPVGYGLVLALLLVETFRLLGAGSLFGLARGTLGLDRGPRPADRAGADSGGPALGRRRPDPARGRRAGEPDRPDRRAPPPRSSALVSLTAPGLASALLILLLGFAAGNRLLAALGILSLLGFVTHFYYSLHATLLEKSGILAVTGLALLAAWFVLRRIAPPPARRRPAMRKAVALLAGLAVLALVNFGIYQRELLLTRGSIVLLELAPVDPRSLMQGDYMRLNFALANEAFPFERRHALADGHIVVALDAHRVGHFRRLADGRPLAPGEIALRYRVRGGQPNFATNAYFFEEGQARRLCKARRMASSGSATTAR